MGDHLRPANGQQGKLCQVPIIAITESQLGFPIMATMTRLTWNLIIPDNTNQVKVTCSDIIKCRYLSPTSTYLLCVKQISIDIQNLRNRASSKIGPENLVCVHKGHTNIYSEVLSYAFQTALPVSGHKRSITPSRKHTKNPFIYISTFKKWCHTKGYRDTVLMLCIFAISFNSGWPKHIKKKKKRHT